jgi:hypothetical protein
MTENSAFCYNKHKVKAIVLGADPGNFSNHGKSVEIKVAFAIGSGDPRYFDPILKNLESIGLSLKDVYIQNLITINQGLETGPNPDWEKLADENIRSRIDEFNQLDPHNTIPVLVTAERIIRYLALDKLPIAEMMYSEETCHPISISRNKLGRPIFPFFRHAKYDLHNDLCIEYQKTLQELFR